MKVLAENRRAWHDFNLQEKFEAGLVLTGPEVKSAKAGRVNLQGSYVLPRAGELWLVGCHIAPYPPAKGAQVGYDPTRERKLLLKREELVSLVGRMSVRGLTLVPLKVYTAHRLVKVELAVASGKKKYDKRQVLKKRETDREIRRTLKY